MIPRTLSAIDSVSPAMEMTKHVLFKPFRWARWWRVALLGLVTGEMSSCNVPNFGDIGTAIRDEQEKNEFIQSSSRPEIFQGMDTATVAAIVGVLVVGVIVLALVHLYIASVLRFVLLEGVVTNGAFRLREGWSRWQEKGGRFFLFQLALAAFALLGYGLLIGLPLFLAWKSGVLQQGKENIGAVLLGMLGLLPFILIFALITVIIHIIGKDFALPIVALEDVTMTEAFSRAWRMIKAAKGDFAGYLGMKIVLAIAIGIALAIIQIIVLFVLVILPAIVIAVIMASAGKMDPALAKSPAFWTVAILIGMFVVALFLFLLALIATPAVVFFQGYVVNFFGSRYEPLWRWMHPEMDAPPPPAYPEPPPLPPGLEPGTMPSM